MPNKHNQRVIAIDGPSASGKSSVSKKLAEHYGAVRLEGGIFYRMITLYMLEHGLDPHTNLTDAQQQQALSYANSINWADVTAAQNDERIHGVAVSSAVAKISGIAAIHDCVDEQLARFIDASTKPVVIEGRTIAKYVYPQADIRFYIDADLRERAVRRAASLQEADPTITYEQVMDSLAARDAADESRPHKPTGYDVRFHDVRIDTTIHTANQTTANVMRLIEEKLPELKDHRIAIARVGAFKSAAERALIRDPSNGQAERA